MARVTRVRVRNEIPRLLGLRGWTDGMLAARAGLPRVRVNRIKNGRARPTVGEAFLLAAAFGLRVAAVFRLDEPVAWTRWDA
jgi:DNA-binding XRE family transcriptional regulator